MQTTTPAPAQTKPPEVGRKVGYLVAALVNAVMIVVVNNLLEWGWPAFLTEDFERLLPLINLSLGATILANLAWVVYDARWFKAGAQAALSAVSLVVAIRTYQVFPFDFSAWETFPAETTARVVIILTMVALGISIIAELAKMVGSLARGEI